MGSIQAPASKLFTPLQIGRNTLSHRVVMAPLTRMRANDDRVHNVALASEYYTQRAAIPGTLIITEATYVSPNAVGYPNIPGIWSEAQVAAWKEIVAAVHAKGSFIWLQLWAMGRAANPQLLAAEGQGTPVAPSAIPMGDDAPTPRELSEDEIKTYIANYTQAARNAIEGAGFDGVEIHGANGYLIDQFTQDVSNTRTDGWGGSIEKRSRFALEVSKSIVAAVGADRVGYRISPWSTFQGMKMADPTPQFSHLVSGLKELKLAYLHVVESRVSGYLDVESEENNHALLKIWGNTSPVLSAGGYTPEIAKKAVEEGGEYHDKDVAVVFGRHFISNPDLVYRLRHGVPFTKYDRDLFYNLKEARGYTDYAYSKEFEASVQDAKDAQAA
ncbi:NADH flavin oxidoreductase/12-oxophytodienoate reductase [Polychaeton citri CBS 116435]|uniref:NADH flavin oxidoreductase/12-oxophytodienoate reductase n=1 Tax=Polychaeton citri CBS 116435 TaxID=1314669 RepID=A0A9P4PY87_9PEZI|nr:NADH flavin oxidoreductase/12-oxophytodienoate reductase [Polychaeton citri CBS 116435]